MPVLNPYIALYSNADGDPVAGIVDTTANVPVEQDSSAAITTGTYDRGQSFGNDQQGNPIYWDSQPLYMTSTVGSNEDQDDADAGVKLWNCQNWIDYHKALVAHYGNDADANKYFMQDWSQTSTVGSATSLCSTDADFVAYFKQHGLDLSSTLGNVAQKAGAIVQSAGQVLSNLGGGVMNFATVIEYLPYVVAGLAVFVVLVWTYSNIYKKGGTQ